MPGSQQQQQLNQVKLRISQQQGPREASSRGQAELRVLSERPPNAVQGARVAAPPPHPRAARSPPAILSIAPPACTIAVHLSLCLRHAPPPGGAAPGAGAARGQRRRRTCHGSLLHGSLLHGCSGCLHNHRARLLLCARWRRRSCAGDWAAPHARGPAAARWAVRLNEGRWREESGAWAQLGTGFGWGSEEEGSRHRLRRRRSPPAASLHRRLGRRPGAPRLRLGSLEIQHTSAGALLTLASAPTVTVADVGPDRWPWRSTRGGAPGLPFYANPLDPLKLATGREPLLKVGWRCQGGGETAGRTFHSAGPSPCTAGPPHGTARRRPDPRHLALPCCLRLHALAAPAGPPVGALPRGGGRRTARPRRPALPGRPRPAVGGGAQAVRMRECIRPPLGSINLCPSPSHSFLSASPSPQLGAPGPLAAAREHPGEGLVQGLRPRSSGDAGRALAAPGPGCAACAAGGGGGTQGGRGRRVRLHACHAWRPMCPPHDPAAPPAPLPHRHCSRQPGSDDRRRRAGGRGAAHPRSHGAPAAAGGPQGDHNHAADAGGARVSEA